MAGKNKRTEEAGEHAILILPGIYNETLTLLVEAHDYFHRHADKAQAKMEPRERTMFTSEMSRVTIRLSCVMAWLMARKAALEGKIPQESLGERYRLDCRDVSMNQHIEAESLLPERMNDLLDKSFELYQRIARLDEGDSSK